MARGNKKGKLFRLFKDHFKITFFHKPTMLDDDIFYYIILDDIIKLKIKLIYGAIVVDDIIPLTTMYLVKEYETLINIFIKQEDFTVLISLTGNTSAFSTACIKANAPMIDDPRFLCIPRNVYDNLREYYKDDISKYGFYLLAVKEVPETVDNQNHIEAGNIPLIDKIMTKFQDKFRHSVEIVTEYDTWKLGKIIKIKGIQFKITYDDSETKHVGLYDFVLNEMESYMDLITICTILEEYSRKGDIILHNVTSNHLLNICEAKGYRNISDTKRTLFSNQQYKQSIVGDYKIEKIF